MSPKKSPSINNLFIQGEISPEKKNDRQPAESKAKQYSGSSHTKDLVLIGIALALSWSIIVGCILG